MHLNEYPNLRPLYGRLLEFRRSKLRLLKCTFYAKKNFIRRPSRSISSHFGAIHSNCAPQYFGGLRSFKVNLLALTPIKRLSLVMISSICLCLSETFHTRQANSGKITFWEGSDTGVAC